MRLLEFVEGPSLYPVRYGKCRKNSRWANHINIIFQYNEKSYQIVPRLYVV